MHFTPYNIEIPDELIQYHEEGKLVLFCGAGISVNAGLPLFKGLTEHVVEEVNANSFDIERLIKSGDYEQVFQQILSVEKVERSIVYDAVRNELSPEESDLNRKDSLSIHEILLSLGLQDNGRIKIVTTNFDCLFDEVISRKEIDPKYYRNFTAPALPIPEKEWDGIVYLHGKLDSTTGDNLILSSGDFGSAYLKHGWAAKFITDLFKNNAVCFIGYSANDTVMRYMLDALAMDKREYPIFAIDGYETTKHSKISKSDVQKYWDNKDVQPVLYPVERKKHTQLINLLREWSVDYQGRKNAKAVIDNFLANFQAFKKDEREIKKFLWVLSDRSNDYENMKYFCYRKVCPPWEVMEILEKNIFDVSTLKRFGVDDTDFRQDDEETRTDSKLKFSLVNCPLPSNIANWSINRGSYELGNYKGIGILNEYLCNWVLRHLNNEETFAWVWNHWANNNNFKSLLRLRLSSINSYSFKTITEIKAELKVSLYRIPNVKMRRLWTLFLELPYVRKSHALDYVNFKEIKDLDIIKSKIRHVLTSRPSVREFMGHVNVDVYTIHEGHSTFVNDIQQPLYKLFDTFNMLLYSLVEMDNAIKSYYVYSISSIAEHSQNSYSEGFFEIIRGARESWIDLCSVDIEKARLQSHIWFASDHILLKRMALFTATHDNVVDIDTATLWLEKVYADEALYFCKHEEMQLLRSLSERGLNATQQEKLESIILENYKNKTKSSPEYEGSHIFSTLNRFERLTGGNCSNLLTDEAITFYNDNFDDKFDLSSEQNEFPVYSFSGPRDKNEIAVNYPKEPVKILEMLVKEEVDPEMFSDGNWNDDVYRKYKTGWEIYVEKYGFDQSIDVICYMMNNAIQYYIPMMAVVVQKFDHKNLNSNGDRSDENKNISDKIIDIFPISSELLKQEKFYRSYCDFIKYEISHNDANQEFVIQRIKELSPIIGGSNSGDEPINDALNSSIGRLISALMHYVDDFNRGKNSDDYEIPIDAKPIIKSVLENPEQSEAWGAIGGNLYNLNIYDQGWVRDNIGIIIRDNEAQRVAILKSVMWRRNLNANLAGFIFPFLKQELLSDKNNLQNTLEYAYSWVSWISHWNIQKVNMKIKYQDIKLVYDNAPPVGIYYIINDMYSELRRMKSSSQRQEFIRNVIEPIWKRFVPRGDVLNNPDSNVMQELYNLCLWDNTEGEILFKAIKPHLKRIQQQYIHVYIYGLEDVKLSENHARAILLVLDDYYSKHKSLFYDADDIIKRIKGEYPDIDIPPDLLQ